MILMVVYKREEKRWRFIYCVKKIEDDLFWIGGNDRRLNLFENVHPIPGGISYNSYILLDEKTVLVDTVDKSVSELFFENLVHVLGGRTLDYIIVNHMEPDHCAALGELLARYPEVKVVGNQKTFQMIQQFFDIELGERAVTVSEGDTLSTGRHTLSFIMMPMVHWPEAMATFDQGSGLLFSSDAFGSFGALNGHIFADESDFKYEWQDESRRYYTNIVGKYGPQVQAVLKKAASLDIKTICPLHGPIWRKNLGEILGLYDKWSRYEPEENGVLIAYGSIYGHTENAANVLASMLSDAGAGKIVMHDVSVTNASYIISDAFRYSHIVFASSTYNNGIFPPMETLLQELKAHNLQSRKVALIENGTWSPASGRLMAAMLGTMKNMTQIGETITLRSALAPGQEVQLNELAKTVAGDFV